MLFEGVASLYFGYFLAIICSYILSRNDGGCGKHVMSHLASNQKALNYSNMMLPSKKG